MREGLSQRAIEDIRSVLLSSMQLISSPQSAAPLFSSWKRVPEAEPIYTQGELDHTLRRWNSTQVQQRLRTAFTHLLQDDEVVATLTESDPFGEQLRIVFPKRARSESAMDPYGTLTGQPVNGVINRLLRAHNETVREEYALMSDHLGRGEYDATVWDDWHKELDILDARIFQLPLSDAGRLQLIPRLASAVGMVNRYSEN